MPDETAAGQPERLLRQAKDIYRWRGRKMGRTILRAHKGTLLLTNHRLVFLSSGGTDAWRRMAWVSLGLGPAPVANAATVTDVVTTVGGAISRWFGGTEQVDPSHIGPLEQLKEGSLSVPLATLAEFGVTQRRFSSYLWIAYPGPDGEQREFAFSNQTVIPGGAAWTESIRAARAALAQS